MLFLFLANRIGKEVKGGHLWWGWGGWWVSTVSTRLATEETEPIQKDKQKGQALFHQIDVIEIF